MGRVVNRNFMAISPVSVNNGKAMVLYDKKDWPEVICFHASLQWKMYNLLQRVPNQYRNYGGVCITNTTI
jgi:hypothetical protein